MKRSGVKRDRLAAAMASPAKQLAGFLAKYDPAVAKLARATRAALRKRLPTAIELVYDNYQFLAIGFSATERASDCLVSLATSPKAKQRPRRSTQKPTNNTSQRVRPKTARR